MQVTVYDPSCITVNQDPDDELVIILIEERPETHVEVIMTKSAALALAAQIVEEIREPHAKPEESAP